MKKRGQIAVFLILGLMIIALFGFVYYAQGNLSKIKTDSAIKRTSKGAFDSDAIKKYADACLQEVSEKGIWLIGEHGGYIPNGSELYGNDGVTPISSTYYQEKKVPYYLEGADFNYTTLDDMEEKLSAYIITEFERCLDLTLFEDAGFDITGPDSAGVDSNISINNDSVAVLIEYPLEIRKKDSEIKLKDFRIDLPIRLGGIYWALVNNGTPIGLLNDIKNEWDDGDMEQYNLSSFVCDDYDNTFKQDTVYLTNDLYISSQIMLVGENYALHIL